MQNRHVYVLTIPLVGKVSESDRRLTQTLLRRRADGPLLLRDNGQGKCMRSEGKLRTTSRTPCLQAVFSDREGLACALEDLRTWAPPLEPWIVRYERRRARQADPPCSCILTEVCWDQRSWCNIPRYSQMECCQRHSPRSRIPGVRLLTPLVRQQVLELVQDFPASPRAGLPMLVDELPQFLVRSDASDRMPLQLAALLRDGRKLGLHS